MAGSEVLILILAGLLIGSNAALTYALIRLCLRRPYFMVEIDERGVRQIAKVGGEQPAAAPPDNRPLRFRVQDDGRQVPDLTPPEEQPVQVGEERY